MRHNDDDDDDDDAVNLDLIIIYFVYALMKDIKPNCGQVPSYASI